MKFNAQLINNLFWAVRSKAKKGQWRKFDYEKQAKNSRFQRYSQWLLDKKPQMEELLYNGIPMGYFKCCSCESQGDLHIIKSFDDDKTKIKTQYMKKHLQSRSHLDSGFSKLFTFS